MQRLGSLLLLVGFTLSVADISGDFIYIFGVEVKQVPELQSLMTIQELLIPIWVVLAVLGLTRIISTRIFFRVNAKINIFVLSIIAINIGGAVIGLLDGNRLDLIVDDSRNMMLYLIFYAIVTTGPGQYRLVLNILAVVLFMTIGKIFISYASDVVMQRNISWRYFVKAAIFLMPLIMLQLANLQYGIGNIIVTYLKFLVIAVTLLLVSMVGYYVAIAVSTLYYYFMMRVGNKHLKAAGVFGLSLVLIIAFIASFQLSDYASTFTSGEEGQFIRGVDHRFIQITYFRDLLLDRPFGSGFGHFDPINYAGYKETLGRVQLVELEFHALFAKLGIVLFPLFLSAWGFLIGSSYKAINGDKNPTRRSLLIGMTFGLIALLCSSLFQTAYSSFYFHLYVVLLLLVLNESSGQASVSRRNRNHGIRHHVLSFERQHIVAR